MKARLIIGGKKESFQRIIPEDFKKENDIELGVSYFPQEIECNT